MQLEQAVLLEAAPELLSGNLATRFTTMLQRSFLRDRLQAEVRSAFALPKSDWLLFPRLSYQISDDLTARLGYLWIGGPEISFFGEYKRNDEVVFDLRYTF